MRMNFMVMGWGRYGADVH